MQRKYTLTELKAIEYHCTQNKVKVQLSAWPEISFRDSEGQGSKMLLSHLVIRYKNKKEEEKNEIS